MCWNAKTPSNICSESPVPVAIQDGSHSSRERIDNRQILVTGLLVWMAYLCPCGAQDNALSGSDFDWQQYRTSPVDLLIKDAGVFHHRRSGLDSDEQRVWQELLDKVMVRRRAVKEKYPRDTVARWETAFYRFAELRRSAWAEGSLQMRNPIHTKDPFRPTTSEEAILETVPQTDLEYSVITDIQSHPEDFVGKPVVIWGILQRPKPETMAPSEDYAGPKGIVLSIGELFPFSGANTPLARVQTTGVDRTCGKNPGTGFWPGNKNSLPVLVKGWFVKLWDDQRPLICCESVRELSVQPPTTLIRQYTISRQPLLDDESWLYYETLSTLEMVQRFRTERGKRFWQSYPRKSPPESPQRVAETFLRSRLDNLLEEITTKYQSDTTTLESSLQTKKLSRTTYDFEMNRLQYLRDERVKRYNAARTDPDQFETYVDLFMNPDVWQGQLITLRGHVRHVVSFPASHPEFHGRLLHEMWLFTDDSQNNPAVVVTATLPQEFPVDADFVDQVSVTGCVFKQYVYRAQESRRVAPLILTDSIQWSPTDSHILALEESGHLSGSSPMTQRAKQRRARKPGGIALLLGGFLVLLSLMVLWGRAQRDLRQRQNLLSRIAENPEFGTSLDSEYPP